MGLLSAVLLLPLAPVRGVAWVTEVMLENAERELYGPGPIRARLAELGRSYEDGTITEEEFEREEERLLDLLDLVDPEHADPMTRKGT